VLAGVPWWRIGPEGAATLARFVAGGGRLLVLGGAEGYGPGGWGGTPLERALLPLTVRTPPGAGADWALALDVSGSTRGERLGALKAAARATLDALQPGERLAVLPFRGRAATEPLAPGFVAAGDAEAARTLEASLGALEAGGETDLVAGVGAALALLSARAGGHERRLVLLTDGDPDDAPDENGWRALRPRLESARVRFGAVVVGMRRLAEVLRTHVAPRPESVVLLAGTETLLPNVLRELARQRAESERGRLGAPVAVDASTGSWAALLPSGWSPAWVHDLEPHAEARVVARARFRDGAVAAAPFAAERTVGAGVVQALAWGADGPHEADGVALLLAPLARRLAAEGDRGLAADLDDEGRLEVRVPEATGAGALTLVGQRSLASLLEVAPGLFRSEEPVPDEDGLRVRGATGGAALERVLRLPVRPLAEHRGTGPDRARLAALAEAGGGRVLAPGERAPVGAPTPGPSFAPWLLLAACILLLWDRARA
jgi:Ca-activated chloride channel homolog